MSFRNDDDFDSESYVRVNTRLEEFWAKYPEGRLITDAVEMQDGKMKIVASLFRDAKDEKPASTGHAFLLAFDGDKVGEYTETVAVGRALALMGFQVEKSIATAEEMQRFKENKNKKAAPKVTPVKEAPKVEAKEVSSTPEVPKQLRPSRIFKPLPKQESK